MYCEGTAYIFDENDCRAATHVFIYTYTTGADDSLRPRDSTQWLQQRRVPSEYIHVILTTSTNHVNFQRLHNVRISTLFKCSSHNVDLT